MTDDAQIAALFARTCRAWTDGDAQAYGACFTDDCDYVSFDGARAQGRRAVVESHDRLFRGVLFGSALVGDVESIRYVGEGVALVRCRNGASPATPPSPCGRRTDGCSRRSTTAGCAR